MQTSPHAYIVQVQETMARYLSAMPDESSFLSDLQALLINDPKPFSQKNMAGHVTTSALILSPEGDQVLMIHDNENDSLRQPWSHYEGGNSLKQSARREGMEKAGVTALNDHPWTTANDCPFDIDTHVIDANTPKVEAAHVHHDVLFVFQADPMAMLKPQMDDVSLSCWFPVEVLKDCGDARLKRLHAKLLEEGLAKAPSKNMRP